MRWIAISGSRETNKEIERDVRDTVREILERGDGIITGGALGVDWFATDEALRIDKGAHQIKVFLPTSLEMYADHYRKRVTEGVITHDQAEMLIAQLRSLKTINPYALIENAQNSIVDMRSYYERNTSIIYAADELIAFQVNESSGTQDTINKARRKEIFIELFQYTIP
ncbi:MAG: hypothetical protein G01um101433_466 [Parcubacteria group bacterium Gr01-1014_33]|nr:MAG: hypothetical protein G01um101433_466 [Parcubacteria group bacterium Gr01-1014_33]